MPDVKLIENPLNKKNLNMVRKYGGVWLYNKTLNKIHSIQRFIINDAYYFNRRMRDEFIRKGAKRISLLPVLLTKVSVSIVFGR